MVASNTISRTNSTTTNGLNKAMNFNKLPKTNHVSFYDYSAVITAPPSPPKSPPLSYMKTVHEYSIFGNIIFYSNNNNKRQTVTFLFHERWWDFSTVCFNINILT